MKSFISTLLIVSIFSISLQSAEAKIAMLPTMSVVQHSSYAQTREDIVSFVKQEKVQKEMIKYGVNPEEALNRIATLSPSELDQLSAQMNKAQAGSDFGVGSIVGAALFVFIVLLITDILGFTKVYPFTRSIR
jgi:Skp family chaperone for outer membrane proteins